MITEESDRIMANLAKIELGFSNIYEHFSKRDNLSIITLFALINGFYHNKPFTRQCKTLRKRLIAYLNKIIWNLNGQEYYNEGDQDKK